jgi:phospholipase/carboxylesterase
MTGRHDGEITAVVREAAGDPAGALVLFHGRGADEHDLNPLLDMLDPERRLLGVTPRGPFSFPPGGAHWYALRQVGYPDRETFLNAYENVGAWLDGFLEEHGIPHDKAVLGGFSQGGVMAYSFSLGAGRPRPAATIALSSFIPTVEGFELDLSEVPPVAIGHGTLDPIIPVEFGRQARKLLEDAGASVLHREYPLPHAIDPTFLLELRGWLARVAAAASEA